MLIAEPKPVFSKSRPQNGIDFHNSQEFDFNVLDHANTIDQPPAIVYSESLEARNYLRTQVFNCGLNAVCFGYEAICYDNFKPIRPKIVIAETDSEDIVWRFLFAMHTNDIEGPMVVVSDSLKVDPFNGNGSQANAHVIAHDIAIDQQLDRLLNNNMVHNNSDKPRRRLPLLVGQTEAISRIKTMLQGFSQNRDAVLVTGEKGVGKELLARLIVGMSKVQERFIKIDCSELKPDMLVNGWLEKTLDGRTNGKPATIFLNHLDKLSMASQAEMLLVMDTSKINGNRAIVKRYAPTRFLAASNRPIDRLVQQGAFRKDLFYRLNVIPVAVPALRDRKADISLLMDFFIIEACSKMQKCITIPSKQARQICSLHTWPGNLKELQHQMTRVAETGNEACLFANTSLPKLKKDTPEYLFNTSELENFPQPNEIKDCFSNLKNKSLKGICDEFVSRTERRLMKKALESTNWNRKKAAQLLNISYKSMLNKMKAYDIT